ncbi:hypothetical protein E5P55_01085 [Candidatus Pinguicoccus supinus]|uniref:Uncharacterized protein n=1 Tax=Candidatus Pinguicoccus supinus TaxID=2529394 RepID=A0A7T0BSL0_9BACT|nr:hypothetical protein E5P55_01085 [Candidatus Pinguicoccus supinus]
MPYTGKVEILNHNILTKKFVIKRLLKLGFYFFKNFYSKKLLVINPQFKYFYKKKLQIYFNFVKLFTQEYSRVLFNYTSLNRLIMKSKGITTNSKLVDFSIKKYLKHISFLEIRTSTILKKIQNLNSLYVELNDNYYLRQSLIPNILQSLVLNEYRIRSGCYYYELGTVFPEENKTIFELNSLASVFLYNFHINFF